MMDLHQVVSAEPVDDRRIRVSFENGMTGIFDCLPYMGNKYWEALKNPVFFRLVKAEYGTLCWPNDIDIDPEEIWEDTVFDRPAMPIQTETDHLEHFVSEDGAEYDAHPPATDPAP